ncbi:tripartite tricarboxylate transporter substrate binding protein [Geomicrobium sediminis]|uniref:Tripartite-type tricarboxylate transporter receptor subunit TctC n=1 Tax=Geomicrobium sediminis TaxID=1347788 RepID=A0ABS2PBS7_9BACL|nr:tripartite tricarboxylate transporter substrate binding protein [Geomicrobium sediminis]MBM7632801.1 tripartite-type tricarboxylate transporter receptor subunit TctC [Geomicrobium sediminis]
MWKKIAMMSSALLVVVACSNSSGSSPESFPEQAIEIIAPATPGGGWDMTARSIQRAMNADGSVDQDITVVNKPGGGGEVGWQYLNQQDGHFAAVNSSLLVTGNLLDQSDLTHEDFTPLAMLSTEWLAVATHRDAGFSDGTELMDQLREDPQSLTIGVSPSLGSGNHLAFVQAAVESGVDPTELQFLVYSSGGDIMNALLGGHIDVTSNSMSDLSEQYEVGEIDILAVTSPERLESFPDIPTWEEQGIDMVFPHWRGIMGPADMPEHEVEAWDEWLSNMVETDEWQTVLDNYDLEDFYMSSGETGQFFEEQQDFFAEIIEQAGLSP